MMVLAHRFAVVGVVLSLAACVDDRFDDRQFLCNPKGGNDECPAEMVCGGDGRCARQPSSGTGGIGGDGCKPLTCATAGKQCGSVHDLCGKFIDCTCDLPLSCVSNKCECTHQKVDTKSPRALFFVGASGSAEWDESEQLAALASDNVYVATKVEVADGAKSNVLKLADFGFDLSDGTLVNGIGVSIERSKATGAGDVADAEVRVVLPSGPLPLDAKKAGAWPADDDVVSYGGAGVLWDATSIDLADVETTQFGVSISVGASGGAAAPRIDRVQLSVHYEDPLCPLDGG
jgi:hypothetical protein